MEGNTVIFMVLFGLCILPSCFQVYHVVKDAKTWSEAQSYCREKYTDLVTIDSMEEMVRLSHILLDEDDDDEFWIGLYGDFNNWKWSLEREGFYDGGQADFRMWDGPEPNIYDETFSCAEIDSTGRWFDSWCNIERPFVCYNELPQPGYIYVSTLMNWTDAQSDCRERYIDLPSVRNNYENDEIRKIVDSYTWFGLYRAAWKWSDGTLMHMTSFSNWKYLEPKEIRHSCVTTTHSEWKTQLCSNKYAFVCSGPVTKQVVKVMLTKSDSSVDLEEMQDAIIQKFSQRLKDQGLGEQVKLRWIKQPDGKIFHLKETKDKE